MKLKVTKLGEFEAGVKCDDCTKRAVIDILATNVSVHE